MRIFKFAGFTGLADVGVWRPAIAGLLFFATIPHALAATASDIKARDAAACAQQLRPRPVMSTHQLPPYPEISVRLNEEGSTRLRVTIGNDGVPTDAVVEQGSGSQRLDEAATNFVKATWRWEPVVNFCGAPVSMGVVIDWKLKNRNNPLSGIDPARLMSALSIIAPDDADYPPDALAQKQWGMSGLLVMLSDTGQAQEVIVSTPSGSDSLDQKALQLAKSKFRWTPATLNGKPVGGMMIVMVVWTLPGQPKPDTATLKTFIDLMIKSRAAHAPADPQKPSP